MKIQVKTLKGETQTFEIDPNAQIKDLNSLVSTTLSFPIEQIKLIYKSKQLDPLQSISIYNIKETEFVICMILKVSSLEMHCQTTHFIHH